MDRNIHQLKQSITKHEIGAHSEKSHSSAIVQVAGLANFGFLNEQTVSQKEDIVIWDVGFTKWELIHWV